MACDIETILLLWDRNRTYGLKLTEGLSAAQFVQQPAAAVNHPAWILSHLNTYHDVLLQILRAEPVADPAGAPFGMKSKPEPDAALYDSPDELRQSYARGHDEVAKTLSGADDTIFRRPVPLQRWQGWLPTMCAVLTHLMVWHETVHLGQLSAWRRVLGLPPVSFLPLPTEP